MVPEVVRIGETEHKRATGTVPEVVRIAAANLLVYACARKLVRMRRVTPAMVSLAFHGGVAAVEGLYMYLSGTTTLYSVVSLAVAAHGAAVAAYFAASPASASDVFSGSGRASKKSALLHSAAAHVGALLLVWVYRAPYVSAYLGS